MKKTWIIALLAVLCLASSIGAVPGESAQSGDDLASSLPSILGVTAVQGGSGLVVLEVTGNLLPAPEIISTGDNVLVLLWSGAYLPSAYWEKDIHTPLVQKVILKQEPDGVHMTIRSTQKMVLGKTIGDPPSPAITVYLSTQSSVSEVPVSIKPPKIPAPGDPLAITTLVTLELRETDLRDVFRMLGGLVDMNIIVDPSVPPMPVTVSLDQVPMNEAFGYLMRMYDVSYAMMGKTIIVGKKENISRTMGMERTRSFHIAYADPKQISALLQSISGESSIVVDERLRTIYVTASEEYLDEITKTLQRIDHPGRQVMLQARIIEVSDEGKDEMKNLLNAVYDKWSILFGEAGASIGYTYSNETDSTLRFLDANLKLLQDSKKAKVLASPSVVTIDGMPAEIKLVREYSYRTGVDEAGNAELEKLEVGPIMKFTPIVGRNEVITIDMDISTGELVSIEEEGTGEIPITSTRNVKTNVRVRDGELFVVGGLLAEQESRNVFKFPIISEIPILGDLFKFRTSDKRNTEVVIILIPYILDVADSAIIGSEIKTN